MKKLKTRYKVLITFGILALIYLILSIVWTLPKYEYIPGEYTGKLEIDGIIYEELGVNESERIYREFEKQGIDPFEDEITIGEMDYISGDDIWKYRIYGNKNIEDRILLRGEEHIFLNDANYPIVYFCRQDIHEQYKEME
ncbi:MAG: hypothetical protein ACM3S4_09780 [Burkholderiales bacterium]